MTVTEAHRAQAEPEAEFKFNLASSDNGFNLNLKISDRPGMSRFAACLRVSSLGILGL